MARTLATLGDQILFKRNDQTFTGKVMRVKENSVLVNISDEDAEKLKLETPITVVAHHHYKILS